MVNKNESAMEINDQEFKETINNGHKLVVVDFFAEWCMPCLMLSPIIEDIASEMKQVKFVKINVDDNNELAGKYQVSSIPCLIFFKDGNEVDRLLGNQTSETIKDRIKKNIE